VTVVEQLHAARLAFYAALYNRSLESIGDEQQQKLEENVASQKNRFEAGLADRSAFTSATIQVDELVPQMEGAHRAYREAQLNLAQAMGSTLQNHLCPNRMANWGLPPLSSMLAPKQRQLYSAESISNSPVITLVCARCRIDNESGIIVSLAINSARPP